VIKNGGINSVIASTDKERRYIDILEEMDKKMLKIRNHIRLGGIIDASLIDFR
jgi:hypothetical protein